MTLRILGVGLHGLTGSHLIPLLQSNSNFNLIAPRRQILHNGSNQTLFLDAADASSWLLILRSFSPEVIVLLSNIRHYIPLLHALMSINKFPRIILIGTTGVHSRFINYSREYMDIEFKCSQYPGHITILRPSMIYGNSLDKNLHKVFFAIDKYRCLPIVGNGANLIQPVYYKDLANAIYSALVLVPKNFAFDIAGAAPLSLTELFTEIFNVLSVRPFFIPLNLSSAKLFCKSGSFLFGRNFPVSVEQVDRLSEDKAFDITPACNFLAYSPTPLRHALSAEASELGLL